MTQVNKDKYVKLNLITSLILQVMCIIFNLLVKAAIKDSLGIDYLGLQTVFGNFCDIFTFAFAGIGTALLYSLYAPVANNNYIKISAIYHFYKKIYNYFSLGVLAVGTISIFLVIVVINADISMVEVIVTYVLYLLSVVITNYTVVTQYFIIANEKHYIVWVIMIITEVVFFAAQLGSLIFTGNYYVYMIVLLVKSLVFNVCFMVYIRSKYNYLNKEKSNPQIKKVDINKPEIYKNTKDLIVARVGNIMINNTDSILISLFVSTAVGGLYANYLFVYTGVVNILGMYFVALTGKIGNLIVTTSKEEVFNHYWKNALINVWINGFCAACFYCLIQDFIIIWMGEDAILPQNIVILVTLNIFIYGMRTITTSYRNATGLFDKISKLYIIRGIVNLILSAILGAFFQLDGILVATIISCLAVSYVYEAKILFKYFDKSMRYEVIYQILAILSAFICVITTSYFVSMVVADEMIGFVLKVIVCLVVVNAFYGLCFLAYKLAKRLKGETV